MRSTGSSAPSSSDVAEEFAATAAAAGLDFTDPYVVADRCVQISEEFAQVCRDAGLTAEVVTGAEFGEIPELPGVRLMLNGHFATLVTTPGESEGHVYDWTARQFDPTAPVPWVGPLPVWRERWRELG